MPLQPVEYHPFQYPRKYRPLGYGSWEPPAPPSEPERPRGGRRFVVLILAALLATIVIHVGIAMAYDGGTSSAPTASPNATAPEGENACDPGDEQFVGPDFQEGGDPGAGGAGTGPTDPTQDDDGLRGRL